MPAKLRNGNVGARGGRRKGAGRKPNWFKEQCRKRLERPEVLKLVDGIVSGKQIEPHVTKGGGVIYTEPRSADRLAAVEFLRDTGIGKPASVIDMSQLEDGEGRRITVGVVVLPSEDQGKAGEVK